MPETATDARLTTTTLTYDTLGNPQTAKAGAHPAVTTAYNSKGWLTSLTDQVGTTTNFPLYNNRGQLKKKTDPLLKDTIFEYDNAGRLDYVINRNNNTIDYSYTSTDKIDTITYPDASTVRFTYNQHDSLTGMWSRNRVRLANVQIEMLILSHHGETSENTIPRCILSCNSPWQSAAGNI